ncbi:MAG TPA: hypothetical protein DCQ98_17890 [Planctomycetaceae bacterium]|nr:hypothetical protein [Planctomycetaceae bacterium]HRE99475.1 hypothetical protein [Pirellulaceae bacterium]
MRQLTSMLRDTWYVWLMLAGFSITLSAVRSWVFLAPLAALPFCMAYFAFMRYDEDGNLRSDR